MAAEWIIPIPQERAKIAAFTEVRSPEKNHREWKEEWNLHLCFSMENLANTSSKVQKPDPEGTQERSDLLYYGSWLLGGLGGLFVCLWRGFVVLFWFGFWFCLGVFLCWFFEGLGEVIFFFSFLIKIQVITSPTSKEFAVVSTSDLCMLGHLPFSFL